MSERIYPKRLKKEIDALLEKEREKHKCNDNYGELKHPRKLNIWQKLIGAFKNRI